MKSKVNIWALSVALLLLTACDKHAPLASGVFEAQVVCVSSETDGKILHMDVEEGDTLLQGQEIALTDTVSYAYQRLTLLANRKAALSGQVNVDVQTSALQHQLETLEAEQVRINRLLDAGAATRKQKEDLEAQIRIVKSQLSAAKATIVTSNSAYLSSAEALDVQIAGTEELLNKCHILSPIEGVVIGKYVREGEVTAQGRPVVKIADMNHVYLRAYFTSRDLCDIRLGDHVQVRACYGGDAYRDYEGTISWIASESEFTPKSIPTNDERANMVYAVKVVVENDGFIKMGMSGEVYPLR